MSKPANTGAAWNAALAGAERRAAAADRELRSAQRERDRVLWSIRHAAACFQADIAREAIRQFNRSGR